jgi:uncharacterized protein (TIGR02145 family)
MNKMKQLSETLHYVFFFVMVLFFSNALIAQEKGTLKDSRDGRVYQWIKIGKKAWLAENLKYDAKPGSWVYNNDTVNASIYGRLYTWNAAVTACPKGWVVPTDADWTQMIAKLGGAEVAGGKMLEMDSAKTLSSLLGGVRHSDSTYTGVALWGGLWSANVTGDVATNYLFARGDKTIVKSSNDKNSAFGVRCVKK